MVLILILMVIIPAVVVLAIIFRLLSGIIGFNFDLFAVATAITTHNNESEREGLDCDYVFEHENAAFAANWFS